MGVPTVLLEWGQDGQGRPLVGTCLLHAGKGREQGKVCQSNPVSPTEDWHRIPVGVMRRVIGACVSRKMRRVFFPLHTGLQSQLAVRGHFYRQSGFQDSTSCVLNPGETCSWLTQWHCGSIADLHACGIWLCQSLGALTSSTGSCLAPLHFWCFSPLLLLSKEKETAGGASSRREKWGFLCNAIGMFSSPHHCAGKSSELYGPRGGL